MSAMLTRYQLIMMCLYRQNDKLYRDLVKMIANKVYKSDDETYNYHLEYCTKHLLFSWFSPKVDQNLIVTMLMDCEVEKLPGITEEFLKSHNRSTSHSCPESMIHRKQVLEDIQLWDEDIYFLDEHQEYYNGFKCRVNSIYLVNTHISWYYDQEIEQDIAKDESLYIGLFVKRPKRFNSKYYDLGHPKSQKFLIHPKTHETRSNYLDGLPQ